MSHGFGGGGGHGHCGHGGHGGHHAHIAHHPDQSAGWNQGLQGEKQSAWARYTNTFTPVVVALVIFTMMTLPFVLDWPNVENAISKHEEEETKKSANYAPQFAPVAPSQGAGRSSGLGIDPFSMPGTAPRSQTPYTQGQYAQSQYAQQQYAQSQYPQAQNPYAQAGQGAYPGQSYGGQPYGQAYGGQTYGAQNYGSQAYLGQAYGGQAYSGQAAGSQYGQQTGRFNRFAGGDAGQAHVQRFKVVVER